MAKLKAILQSIIICVAVTAYSIASAEMLISPTRIVMDNANRNATMILRNTSDGPRTFRLSWEDKQARESGGYTLVEEGELWPASAKDMLRFSPRQILVGPGENQTVRFNWRPPADLASGEYRSHLLLQVIPNISEPTAMLNVDSPEEGLGVQVAMQMSFSIPVIVRNNTDMPAVSMGSVKAVPTADAKNVALQVILNRSGDASSVGRVSVEMQRSNDSPVELIGEKREFAIYSELDSRELTIPLRESGIPAGAIVRIAYEGSGEYQGVLFAEKVFKTE